MTCNEYRIFSYFYSRHLPALLIASSLKHVSPTGNVFHLDTIVSTYKTAHVNYNLLLPNDPRIDVDDIEVLVHPQLMRIITHQHSPMLRWIRIFVDLVCNHLA
jgi:hypothetical protein